MNFKKIPLRPILLPTHTFRLLFSITRSSPWAPSWTSPFFHTRSQFSLHPWVRKGRPGLQCKWHQGNGCFPEASLLWLLPFPKYQICFCFETSVAKSWDNYTPPCETWLSSTAGRRTMFLYPLPGPVPDSHPSWKMVLGSFRLHLQTHSTFLSVHSRPLEAHLESEH